MLVTVAESPKDESVQIYTEGTVSDVMTTISPVIDARPPHVMTYEQVIIAAELTTKCITKERSRWARVALKKTSVL